MNRSNSALKRVKSKPQFTHKTLSRTKTLSSRKHHISKRLQTPTIISQPRSIQQQLLKPKLKTIQQCKFSTINNNIVSPHMNLNNTNDTTATTTNDDDDDGTEFIMRTSTQVAAIDPKDGRINTNPGYVTPPKYPNAQHVVSPHLRQYVHEVDESHTPQQRAPMQPIHLTVGYRYLLRHLKYIPDIQRRNRLREQFRDDFTILSRITDIHTAGVQFDRSIPNIWSQLSVIRMGISKLRRPRIPEVLVPITDYLGAQEGSGSFCAVKSNDDRFNQLNNVGTDISSMRATIVQTRGDSTFEQKAKLYNMDLHPADIERHYELVERFHFNGKERRGL